MSAARCYWQLRRDQPLKVLAKNYRVEQCATYLAVTVAPTRACVKRELELVGWREGMDSI